MVYFSCRTRKDTKRTPRKLQICAENEYHVMKIISCEDEEGCVNAINLETGEGLFYEDDEEIVATKARVEIYA